MSERDAIRDVRFADVLDSGDWHQYLTSGSEVRQRGERFRRRQRTRRMTGLATAAALAVAGVAAYPAISKRLSAATAAPAAGCDKVDSVFAYTSPKHKLPIADSAMLSASSVAPGYQSMYSSLRGASSVDYDGMIVLGTIHSQIVQWADRFDSERSYGAYQDQIARFGCPGWTVLASENGPRPYTIATRSAVGEFAQQGWQVVVEANGYIDIATVGSNMPSAIIADPGLPFLRTLAETMSSVARGESTAPLPLIPSG